MQPQKHAFRVTELPSKVLCGVVALLRKPARYYAKDQEAKFNSSKLDEFLRHVQLSRIRIPQVRRRHLWQGHVRDCEYAVAT